MRSESGAGKTTLLRLLLGLLPPDQGTVRFRGENVTAVEPYGLRRRIGYVVQGGGLFPHLTGEGNVTLVAVVQVGSKVFTESVIVAELATQVARAAGVEAVHRRELGGSRVLWDALLAGEIDVYPEYTGTLTEELVPGDAAGLPGRVQAHGVVISRSLGFSDSYAIGVKRSVAKRLGIRTIQD